MSRSRMWLKNRHQEQIVRLLEQLGAGKLSIWEIWEDFILMSAISIANSVDFGSAQAEREQLYTSISAKYTADEFGLFVEAFSQVVLGLETDPQQDLLGTVFMSLGLNNHWKGQFFTPYDIAKMMAEMTLSDRLKEKIEANGWISVYDPSLRCWRPCWSPLPMPAGQPEAEYQLPNQRFVCRPGCRPAGGLHVLYPT